MKFKDFKINESIQKALDEQGYQTPTPIQEKAIPHALEGKDILGCAQTGTGKTAAFLVPIIQRLEKNDKTKVRSLILTPTRELAIQIHENVIDYAKYTTIKSAVIFGGVSQNLQEKEVKKGVDIIVATPGRLLDLMKQRIVHINQVEIFVLDEADRMLDMGFLFDVKRIIADLPKDKQTLFFSATMPKEIKELTNKLLKDPEVIEVTPPSTTVEIIKQTLYYVDKNNKKFLLLDLLKSEKVDNALVFTRTKSTANKLGKFLLGAGIKTGIIHGNKSQNARQLALSQFKDKKLQVLVATDIAARGIDVNELNYVFNYDMPEEAEAYVHRIGRTGRAGKDGTSISFANIDEVELVKGVQKLIKLEIPVNREHKYPMMDTTLSPKKGQRGSSSKSNKPKTAKSDSYKDAKATTEGKQKDKKYAPKSNGGQNSSHKRDGNKPFGKSFSNKPKVNQQRKPKQASRGR